MIITKVRSIKYESGIKETLTYITDPLKTFTPPEDYASLNAFGPYPSADASLPSGNYSRMVQWANDGSATLLYISGHLCQPDSVLQDFLATAACSSRIQGKPQTAPLAYSFIQSAEDDPQLTPELIHQIGLELGEAELHEFPFVVASHVYPISDKDGTVRGKRMHNHFLVCAYKAPEFCLNEGAVKLHCSQSFVDQLRITNDRLAIEHDLTIIRDPDFHRNHSWYMKKLAEEGKSWVYQMQQIVETVRDQSRNWSEFVEKLTDIEYTVEEGPPLIYKSPRGYSIEATSLGQNYTYEALTEYWLVIHNHQSIFTDMVTARIPPALKPLMDHFGPLFVEIPIGIPRQGRKNFYPLSLQKRCSEPSLRSYFDPLRWYNVKDQNGTLVTQITGHYITEYLIAIRYNEFPVWATTPKPIPNITTLDEEYWYASPPIQTGSTPDVYRVCWYNEDKSRRSLLEVVFRLAAVILLGKNVYYHDLTPSQKPHFDDETRAELSQILGAINFIKKGHIKSIQDLFRLQSDFYKKIAKLDADLNASLPSHDATPILQQKITFKRHIARIARVIAYARKVAFLFPANYPLYAKSISEPQVSEEIPAAQSTSPVLNAPEASRSTKTKELSEPNRLTHLALDEMIRRASKKVERSSLREDPHQYDKDSR